MGIKEDMEGDLTGADKPRASVSVRKKAADPNEPLRHEHGNGMREQPYLDDDGRRRVTLVQGRVPKYLANCKACVAEDVKRMAADAPEHDFDSTVFLIPELAPDSNLATAYLAKRYPGIEVAALSTIRPARLAVRKGASVVVVTRRVLKGQRFVGSSVRVVEDKRGELIEQQVPIEEYLPEIVESAPVVVDDCVTSTAATMFSDAQVDLGELSAQLSDHAAPRYTVVQYQRLPGSDEVVFTMRLLG